MTEPSRLTLLDFPTHLRVIPGRNTMQKNQPHGSTETVTILDEVDQVLSDVKGEPQQAEQTREEQLQALVTTALDHEADAKRHADAARAAKEELRQLLDFGTHEIGNLKVTVSRPASRFNQPAFQAAYPVELNASLYKTVIDTSAIPPKLKAEFTETGTGTGSIAIK